MTITRPDYAGGAMTNEEFEKYLKERYQNQVDWYDRKATKYKKLYNFFQAVVIVLALITPVVIALADFGFWLRWIAIAISALVAIGTSVMKTFRYQEIWITYRTTCETLKKEIHFYRWQLGEYDTASNAMQLFVDRVESLLSQENTRWLSAHSKKNAKEGDAGTGSGKE
jgi:hypothetical protein